MAKNEAKIKFTAETQEFNKQIGKSADEMNELRAELRLNETQMQSNGKSVDLLKKKHDTLEKQLASAASKTEALSQKVKVAEKYFGENSKEASKLRTQLTNAQTAEEKLKKEIADCTEEIKNHGKEVRETAEGFTVMKGAMADLVADGIQAVTGSLADVGKEAFTMANDMDKATNDFITKTGESTDEAEKFEDAMTSIYNGGYGESFEDIAESMATVKNSMGDIGTDELEKLTTDALVLRDTFDFDVNESIRAVNSMMDQFGITADEAYSLIAQGAQNGLNQNGDLLDVVNEYSTQFKNAGYSADDMFNMLANGVDAGTWSVDKLGDAVKEFNIRASDGTVGDSIKENAKAFGLTKKQAQDLAKQVESGNTGAYQKLADKLKSVDDDTKRYQLGVEMFGTMWEDLGEDAVLALLSTKGEIDSTKDALEQINQQKYNDLGSALEGVKRNLQTAVSEPLNNEVLPAVNDFISGVDWQGVGDTIASGVGVAVNGFLGLVNIVKESVVWMNQHKGVVIAVASVIGILATAITAYNVVQGVKAAMDAAQVTTVWALVAAHWAQFTAAMAAIAPYILIVAAIAAVIAIIIVCIKYWDEIVAAVGKCVDWIAQKWGQFTSWLDANVIQPVANWFKNLWAGIKNVYSVVGSWFSEKFAAAKNGVINAWNSVRGWFSNLWAGIKGVFSVVGSWFREKFSAAKNGVTNVWQSITGFFSGIFSKIKSTFAKVKDAILSPFRTAIDKVKGLFNAVKFSFPKIKMPHFSVSPKGWKIGDLLKGSIPKLGISWYADGGIFTKPTIFNTPYGLKGVGEAGAEAVLPIDRLQGYISGAIEKTQKTVNLNRLAGVIEDLANRPIEMNVNGRRFATATASDTDSVGGVRNALTGRGVILD